MTPMPEPGDLIPYSFTTEPGQCFKMVYSKQLQAMHCREPAVWKGATVTPGRKVQQGQRLFPR